MSTTVDAPQQHVARSPAFEPLVLENGARMSSAEFHRLYRQAPRDVRAELIEGVVYMSSPVRRTHGVGHFDLITLLGVYRLNTPGIEGGDNCTVLLGEGSEPQPDLFLRILPECGGQSRNSPDDYVQGAPELLVEIAVSSRSIDLHAKRRDYAKFGAREYVVLIPALQRLHWFDLTNAKEQTLPADGILRSITFPGLWLSTTAILKNNWNAAMTTLHEGLSSPEHQAFVVQLAQRRTKDRTRVPKRKRGG